MLGERNSILDTILHEFPERYFDFLHKKTFKLLDYMCLSLFYLPLLLLYFAKKHLFSCRN